MTPKEKAKELVEKYLVLVDGAITFTDVKRCALIAVAEILKSNPTKIDCHGSDFNYGYYQEVKKEIDNYNGE